MTTLGGISGIVFSGEGPEEPKVVTVLGDEKAGKSVLTTQLMNWPVEGGQPLVLAADARGVDACADVGVRVPHIKIRDAAGPDIIAKTDGVIRDLRGRWRKFDPANPKAFPFSAIVFDCASSFGQYAITAIDETNKNPDKRSDYALLSEAFRRLFVGLKDLGVPVIFYAWWRHAQKSADGKFDPGGAEIPGQWSKSLTGLSDQVLILEKTNGTPNGRFLCPDGFDRKLHTRMHAGTPAGGRYQSRLEPIEEANLGTVLAKLMKII
jgi:hypothetical protein